MALAHYTDIIDTVARITAPLHTTTLGKIVYATYVCLIVWPLQQVYIRGWWKNMPPPDICASLTNHRSEFWSQQPGACIEIIHNNFDSYIVYFQFFLYIVMWILVFRGIVAKLCYSSK